MKTVDAPGLLSKSLSGTPGAPDAGHRAADGLLRRRYGYYARAAGSAVRILAAAVRHGSPRIVVAKDRDFGNWFDLGPQDERDAVGAQAIAAALAAARARRMPISTAGGAHSGAGQTLNRHGIRLRLRAAPGDAAAWHDDDCIEVPGAFRWHEAETAANARGRTIPVLTDNLDTTVGGTLSVGGVGTRSISCGSQVDWVESLTLIRPDGVSVQCSPSVEAELFATALAGL